jgi:hypothetical protein
MFMTIFFLVFVLGNKVFFEDTMNFYKVLCLTFLCLFSCSYSEKKNFTSVEDESFTSVQAVNGFDACGFNKASNVYQFTLTTKEPGGGSGPDAISNPPGTTSKPWTVDSNFLRMKIQSAEGAILAKAKYIIYAECNPNTGKTVVVARMEKQNGEELRNGKSVGIFLAHARWRTIEVLTLPLKNNARQAYLPWVNGKQVEPKNWVPNYPELANYVRNNSGLPRFKLENIYQGEKNYALHEGAKNKNIKTGTSDKFDYNKLVSEHSGFAEVELPVGVNEADPSSENAPNGIIPCQRQSPQNGQGFFFQSNDKIGFTNGYVVRQCMGNAKSEALFVQVLEFVKCKSAWNSNTKFTGKLESDHALCGGNFLY